MIYVLLTQLSFSVIQFVIIFIILNNDGVEMVGYYGLMTAILNPFQQLFKFGAPKLISTSKNKIDIKEYFNLGLILFFSFNFLGLIFTYFLYDLKYITLFTLILIYKGLMNLRDVNHAIYIRNELFKKFFFSGFVFNFLILISFYLVYHLTANIVYAFLTLIIILIIINMIDIFNNRRFLGFEIISLERLKIALKLSVADGIFSLKSSMPRYLIAKIFDIYLVGVYTTVFQAVSVLEIINQAVVKFNYKNLTESFHSNIDKFKAIKKNIYFQLFVLTSIAVIINLIFGKELISYFLDEELEQFYWLLILLIFARFFSMINSIPKINFIFINKINYNSLNTFIVTLISFLILYNINYFELFIIITVIFELILFIVNRETIIRLNSIK